MPKSWRLALLLIRTAIFLGCALCLMAQSDQEYGGPAILSRGQTPTLGARAPVAFRPYIGLSGIYDNGLLPVSVNGTGQIPSADAFGVQLNLGLYGYHTWSHSTLGLDYRGDFRHYSPKTYYDGFNQSLALIFTHEPSRHVMLTLRNAAGIYTLNSFLAGFGGLGPAYLQLPQNDIYDNQVVFLNTSADLTYRKSTRLSFNIGGEGDLVRRRSNALYGVTGATARADMQYRITRHTTVGLDYRFIHFDYTKAFGNANVHTIGIDYSTQFTRHLQFSARVGGARIESLNLALVHLDPTVAALLGQSVGVQAAYRLGYMPDILARLTETFRRSTFGVGFSDTVNPGNGVYLTSRAESATASYSYTGLRYWNFGIDANYSRLTALVQTLGAYDTYGASGGVTRQLGKGLHAVLHMDARHYNVAGGHFKHDEYRVTLGLTYSPGDLPLALW
jgi:hypothetical protein